MLNSKNKNKHITIVEDDPFAQDFYKLIFSKAGYSCDIFEDGDLLINFLEQNLTNLVIMDINLKNAFLSGSRIDGVILASKLKEFEFSQKIPVLMVTAFTDYNGKDIKSFADDYIVKPIVDFNKLLSKVGKLVERE
ncbi:MAG: hypothetical protein SCALA702_27160 [Melioribacteraceae bacterium]|nr:MAG: hypothetical protein SCALA702_27160 [Melioribacteraceae bacterium]